MPKPETTTKSPQERIDAALSVRPDHNAEGATSLSLSIAELRPLVKALNYIWARLSLVPRQEVAGFARGLDALEAALKELEDAQ